MIERKSRISALAVVILGLIGGIAAAQTDPAPPAETPPATGAEPSASASPTERPAADPSDPASGVASPDVVTSGTQDAASAVAALSPAVSDVQIVGPWTEGERRGNWRVVMLQSPGEAVGNRLFIQQVEESASGLNVASTTEIVEVPEVDGAIVSYHAGEPSEGAGSTLTLFFDIVPLDGEIAETYELFLTPGSPYIFGPASN